MSLAQPSNAGPFDRVVLVDASGERVLSPAQFLALPLSQRIRVVLERSASFYLGSVEVDRNDALDALRRSRASI